LNTFQVWKEGQLLTNKKSMESRKCHFLLSEIFISTILQRWIVITLNCLKLIWIFYFLFFIPSNTYAKLVYYWVLRYTYLWRRYQFWSGYCNSLLLYVICKIVEMKITYNKKWHLRLSIDFLFAKICPLFHTWNVFNGKRQKYHVKTF
jgi:hypothetical protein